MTNRLGMPAQGRNMDACGMNPPFTGKTSLGRMTMTSSLPLSSSLHPFVVVTFIRACEQSQPPNYKQPLFQQHATKLNPFGICLAGRYETILASKKQHRNGQNQRHSKYEQPVAFGGGVTSQVEFLKPGIGPRLTPEPGSGTRTWAEKYPPESGS